MFETENKGLGVYTESDIPSGAFIGEYVGEIVSSAQAEKRLKSLGITDPCYIVTYKEHMPNGRILMTNIDATTRGNITRFVNHSCLPNTVMLPVRIDSILPRLCLFACKDVGVGDELCFSYFGKSGAEVAAAPGGVSLGGKQCLCNSKNCVGFLPLECP